MAILNKLKVLLQCTHSEDLFLHFRYDRPLLVCRVREISSYFIDIVWNFYRIAWNGFNMQRNLN